MPVNYQPAGDLPAGYAGLLSSIVKGPNGTLVMAPQFSGPTSVDEIYRGMFSQPSPSDPVGPGSDWNSLIGMTGDPIYGGGSNYGQPPATLSATRAEQVRPRPLNAGGNAGSSPALAAIADLVGIPQASGTINGNKDQARMPDTPLLAFNGDQGPNVPLPRPRPAITPLLPQARQTPFTGADGRRYIPDGPDPSLPGGGNVYRAASDGYTVKKGDTLSAISKRSGVPVAVLVATNSIRNPNKIYPGQTINFGSIGGASNPMSSDPGKVDWSIANQGMQGLAGPVNATTLTASQGGGGNAGNGGGTIYSNPNKYGATSADRQASAAARASLLAQFGG